MRIFSRLGIAVLLAVAAYGGARVGWALHGPLADELQMTRWRGQQALSCSGAGVIELRGETVDFASGPAIEAYNGCDVVLVDCDLRAAAAVKVVNHGHLTIERGQVHGHLDLWNDGTTRIHDAHVDSIEMTNNGSLSMSGGSIDQLVVSNSSQLNLDGVAVKRLGVTNETTVSLHGGSVDQLVMFNHGSLEADDAAVADLDVGNDTRVILRRGTYGLVYLWNGAHAEIVGSTIDELEDLPRGSVSLEGAPHITHQPDPDFWSKGLTARQERQKWLR